MGDEYKTPLHRHLAEEGKSFEAFGDLIGKSRETIRRWALGTVEVPEDMRPVISDATDGKVKFHNSVFSDAG